MRKLVRAIAVVVLCGTLTVTTGCMGLSLFSSEHVHHHGTEEMNQRLDSLEERVDALEKEQPFRGTGRR